MSGLIADAGSPDGKVVRAEGFFAPSSANPAPGSGFALLPVDGTFDTATENVYGLIPLSQVRTKANGSYQVYVRGKDDATDGVCPEKCALRPRDDLDALDVGERELRQVHATAERIQPHPVHEDQRVVRFTAARKEGRQRATSATARHGEPGHRPQSIAKVVDLTRAQRFRCHDMDARRCVRLRHFDLRR